MFSTLLIIVMLTGKLLAFLWGLNKCHSASYEFQFIAQKIENEEWDTLMNLNALYRYQDDCIAFEDNNTIGEFVSDIYPEDMEIENTNVSTYSSTNIDLHISVFRGKYNFKLFDKRKSFNFEVINYVFFLVTFLIMLRMGYFCHS